MSNQVGFAPKASSSSTNIGAIVGGAVGGTAAVAILIGLAFWLGRRSKRRPIHLHIGGGTVTNEKDQEKISIFSDPRRPASPNHSNAAYTVSSLPNTQGHAHSQVYSHSQTHLTPPNSARSASSSHPLLPELQYPASPAFPSASTGGASYPNTPNTPANTNFLSMMSSVPSGGAGDIGTDVRASALSNTTASGGQVSYNRLALSNANTASQYSESGQYGISPYILPASSGTPTSSKSQTQSQPNSAGMHVSYDERLLPSAVLPSALEENMLSNRNSSNLLSANANSPSFRNQNQNQSYSHSQDLSQNHADMDDNVTETATETGASSQSVALGVGAGAGRNGVVAEPFVLSPAPRVRLARNERKNTGGTESGGGAVSVPPPAYTETSDFNVDGSESSALLPPGARTPALVGVGSDAMSPTLVDSSTGLMRSRRTTGAY